MEYEIIDFSRDAQNLRVLILHSDGRREQFGFPLGEGWEDEGLDGELRCVIHIKKVLMNREEKMVKIKDFNVSDLRKKHKGKIISDGKIIKKKLEE